ncbi:MAG: hypothetical protein RJB25_285 [Bacteroidota bacterium]|jgi:hypothetical protein
MPGVNPAIFVKASPTIKNQDDTSSHLFVQRSDKSK